MSVVDFLLVGQFLTVLDNPADCDTGGCCRGRDLCAPTPVPAPMLLRQLCREVGQSGINIQLGRAFLAVVVGYLLHSWSPLLGANWPLFLSCFVVVVGAFVQPRYGGGLRCWNTQQAD